MSEKTINLVLPMPPSVNRYWTNIVVGRRAMNVLSSEALAYKNTVKEIAALDTLVYSDIAVVLKIYRPQRSGDIDNPLKGLFDALKGVVYADDKQIVELHAFRFEDKHNPRIAVQIEVLGLC